MEKMIMFSINQNHQESVSYRRKDSTSKSLALIKITKSPYQKKEIAVNIMSLALIKITKSPYHKILEQNVGKGLALIKITKSPYRYVR